MNDELSARRLGQALREDSVTELLHGTRDEELARLLRTVRALDKPAGMARRARVAALAAVASVAAILLVLTFRPAGDLTYDVRGVARIDERGVSAESGEPVQLRFSDGSQVELSPGARARVDARTPDGAALTLLEGEALTTVRHRARTRWSLSAGPFVVKVVGTRFQASWDSERSHLTVKLYEGAVEVVGGPMHEPLLLRAGQQLEVDARSEALRITPLLAHSSAPAIPRTPKAQATPEPVLRSVAPAPHPASWSTLMTRSDFATIVEQARALGIPRCLSSCIPKDLRILADAARYVGDAALAEASLLALRRRSPAQAHAAGFFLGRLYESQGRSGEALAMYERHLVEAPRGDYAEQAAAGRMRMLLRLKQRGPAREAARRYLSHFPEGVHAAFARRLLEGEAAP